MRFFQHFPSFISFWTENRHICTSNALKKAAMFAAMPMFLLLSIVTAVVATPSFPVWARARGPRAPGSRLTPHTLIDKKNLSGNLFYAACDLTHGCDTLEFATLDLATLAKTDLFDFPLGSYDDAFVADDVLIGNEVSETLHRCMVLHLPCTTHPPTHWPLHVH